MKGRVGDPMEDMELADRRGERGLTLIELMIALLVASLLVGMVFSIYTRMSVAYRAQSSVSELQQSLHAAKTQVAKHVRAAGYVIPDGFALSGVGTPQQPVVVVNDILTGDADFNADELRVFYADADATAEIIALTTVGDQTSVNVDDESTFAIGDLVVISNPKELTGGGPGVAAIAGYDACVVRITNIAVGAPDVITFDASAADFNTATNTHCNGALAIGAPRPANPMMYRLVGRAYRIDPDPSRRSLGVLQVSPSGTLIANDWEDLGIGFTDLQLAARYFENGDSIDADGDGDATRDWYSGAVAPPANAVLIELSVSLAVRTTREVDLVGTSATPNFTENDPDHNRLGDSPSITLSGVPDASRPEQYRGNHIYRWTSMRIDVRNLGVGR